MRHLLTIMAILLSVIAGAADEPVQDRVQSVDGAIRAGVIQSLSREGVVTMKPGGTVAQASLWRLYLEHAKASEMGGRVQVTGDHFDVTATGMTIHDGQLTATLIAGTTWTRPLGRVQAFRTGLIHAEAAATYGQALAAAGKADRLIALSGSGAVLSLEGEVSGYDGEDLTFVYRGETRTLKAAKVYGVVFAGRPAAAESAFRVVLQNDGWIDADAVWLDAATVSLRIGTEDCVLARPLVRMIVYRNPQMKPLSALQPLSAESDAIAGARLSWQPDANALGRPMMIGEQRFTSGIGLHAPAAVTFAVPEGAERFVATIGLDAVLGAIGDCEFVVAIDGEEAVRTRLTGSDPARPVSVELAGARTLTLRVEAGANFDLGDYANWGDARFVMESAVTKK